MQESNQWVQKLSSSLLAGLAAVHLLAASPLPAEAKERKEAFLQSTGIQPLSCSLANVQAILSLMRHRLSMTIVKGRMALAFSALKHLRMCSSVHISDCSSWGFRWLSTTKR